MKNKRTLVERLTFCKYCNKWLAERLRHALGAEEVCLTEGKFHVVTHYEEADNYYGHYCFVPEGYSISVIEGLWIILNHIVKREVLVLHQPKYSEVFTTLTSNEIHKCFIAYEVLCTHANKFTDIMATKYLKHVASYHLWDYDTFMGILDEEYDCAYNK